MRVYCTNPNCPHPEKDITENLGNINPKQQRYCEWCKTERILGNGRYLPLEEIGSGGFGKTFRAHDFNLDQDCAIKILRPVHRLDPLLIESARRGFKQGAKILNNLSHPQIPKVYDYFDLEVSEHQKFFYLVQTYIPGQTLDRELANKTHKRFSETEVVEVLRSLLDIVDYTHQQNVIHRDIKPANIIRHRDNKKLYLIDFDSAIKRELEPEIPVNQSMAMGTPGYAPPEQLSGRGIDRSADLYAIAATCIYLLTGKEPTQICNNYNPLYESWRRYVPTVEKKLADILDKMLSPDPKLRYKSAKEVVEALSAISTPDTVIDPPYPPPPLPPTLKTQITSIVQRLRRIPRRWTAISFVVLVLFVAAIVIVLNRKEPPKPPQPTATSTPRQNPVPPPFAQYFSRGEEALIQQKEGISNECRKAYDFKQKGIDAFKQASSSNSPDKFRDAEKYFKEATEKFKTAFQQSPTDNKCEVDPETWIYYYNSKVATTQSKSSLPTIAVVIPNPEQYRDIALEILRGIAQAVEQNQDVPFQLLIAKENSDNPEEVKKIANFIYSDNNEIPGEFTYFKTSKILGVIGHFTSTNTWLAGDIYEQKQLVLISPTSTAVREGNSENGNDKLSDYVLRTASNDFMAAQNLAKHLAGKLQGGKVMVVFEENQPYSKSLKKEFANTLKYNVNINSENIEYCTLSSSLPQIPEDCHQKARTAKALMLATSTKKMDDALKIAKYAKQNHELRNQQLPLLLGGDVFYSRKTLEELENDANGMVVAVSTHASLATQEFTQKANELWWTTKVSWRTLTSYDAAQAFVIAVTNIRKNNPDPTRQLVYEQLKANNFSAPGATTTKVIFKSDGDRQPLKDVGVLVKVDRNNINNSDEYSFTLVQ